jgi:hypothetical protein
VARDEDAWRPPLPPRPMAVDARGAGETKSTGPRGCAAGPIGDASQARPKQHTDMLYISVG